MEKFDLQNCFKLEAELPSDFIHQMLLFNSCFIGNYFVCYVNNTLFIYNSITKEKISKDLYLKESFLSVFALSNSVLIMYLQKENALDLRDLDDLKKIKTIKILEYSNIQDIIVPKENIILAAEYGSITVFNTMNDKIHSFRYYTFEKTDSSPIALFVIK